MSVWNTLLMMSIFFHHSKLELSGDGPPAVAFHRHPADARDPSLRLSVRDQQQLVQLLSWWDMLHGTFREDVPQAAIEIGVRPTTGSLRRHAGKVTVMPLAEQRDDWRASRDD